MKNKNCIKVAYDPISTLVIGYYPSSIKYGSIPTPNITIKPQDQILDGSPTCVIDGVYKKYIEPDSILLERAKLMKKNKLNKNRNDFCLIPIQYDGNIFATTIEAKIAIGFLANSLIGSEQMEYPNYDSNLENLTLNKNDFILIASLIQAREMDSRNKRKILINEINSCNTIEELDLININFG